MQKYENKKSEHVFGIENEIEINCTNVDKNNVILETDHHLGYCPHCNNTSTFNTFNFITGNGGGCNKATPTSSTFTTIASTSGKKINFHCNHNVCLSHKHHQNFRCNQVKKRLMEKSKKKLEEKAILQAANATSNTPIQDNLATKNKSTDQTTDSNQETKTETNANNSTVVQSKNATSTSNTSVSTVSSNTKTSTVSTSNQSSTSTTATNTTNTGTNGKTKTSQQRNKTKSTSSITTTPVTSTSSTATTSSSNYHQTERCTMKDDCHCLSCIQRQKIVEELIAEEESSKKKKQKKKKSKNKQSKTSATNETDKTDKDDDENKNDKENNEDNSNNNNKQSKDKLAEVNEDIIESLTQQQLGVKPGTNNNNKKNKKNKQSTEAESISISSSSSNITNKDELTLEVICNNIDNGDLVDIQQWIKVKNKNSKNGNSMVDTWSTGIDVDDFEDGENEYDADLDDQDKLHGFKVIQNDKRKMSNNNNDNDNGMKNNDLSILNTACISAIGMAQKAKLIAIEAQIAFNNNELKGAVQYISDALELDPKNPIYYINRAFYHERLNEYEHALKDTESALRYDETKEYIDHALCLKARSLMGLELYEQAEAVFLKLRSLPNKPKMVPFLEKDQLLLRMKKLVSCSYMIPLARLYASKFPTIAEAISAIEANCAYLMEKNLNENDLKYHLILIQQKRQQKQNQDEKRNLLNDQNQLQLCENETKQFLMMNSVDYDDDEIYFSDEEEREIWYSHPDNWCRTKDILKKQPVNFQDTKEPPNSKGQKALWIGNVSPSCSLTFVTNLFMKFGNVTFCKIFSNEQRSTGDVAYLLLHYDNDISPRLVMSYFKEKIVPGISKDDNCPLLIRFRNKNDKIDENGGDNGANINNMFGQMFSGQSISGSGSPSSKTISECYYWRTTGCDRQHCTFRHVTGNKGIDKQAWMRKKN